MKDELQYWSEEYEYCQEVIREIEAELAEMELAGIGDPGHWQDVKDALEAQYEALEQAGNELARIKAARAKVAEQ